ncbi:hypothetical protein [uncultured Vagococcus sp.]|uniref:hypothetical protein n=1 Tax=uncultured Vagococcus sp. TaxID=189676 RepID=UPI0028D129FD|nr:hypothetical protein [uncultured Vagococcus sp.]
MLKKKNNKEKVRQTVPELEASDYEDFDDDEFFMAEEIDGYASCKGVNAQRCTSDCFTQVMLPTISTLN